MGFNFEMGQPVVHEAFKRKMNLSAFLETLDPTAKYPIHERHMDAFERQLAKHDIRTQSDPVSGLICHEWGRFFETDEQGTKEQRSALAAEWLNRRYRRKARVIPRKAQAVGGIPSNKTGAWETGGARFPTDVPLSYSLYPAEALNELRFQQLQPSRLDLLIARTRMINAETFAALYLTDSQASSEAKMPRVEEFAELPEVKFQTSEQMIRVKKYGRQLKMSYEQMRRMQIDMVGWAVDYIAARAAADKEDTAIDVLVNGDTNSGTAATNNNGSTLDSGAAGALTLKMWLKWRMLWTSPYGSNVVIGTDDAIVTLMLLNAGSANIAPAILLGDRAPDALNIRLVGATLDGLSAINDSTAPANKLLALDNNWALEMVQEVGSDIVETDKVISAQYSFITISESVGFAIATKGQNRTLSYTA